MNYYPFHVGDYLSHTRHLSETEDLIYRRLLDLYYLHEQPLNECSTDVARKINMSSKRVEVEKLLNEFFEKINGFWINARADDEILKYQNRQKANQKAGIKSGKVRRKKAKQMLNARSTNVEPTRTITRTITKDKNKQKDLSFFIEVAKKVKSEYPKGSCSNLTVDQIAEHLEKKKRSESYCNDLLKGLNAYPKWFANATRDFPNRKHKDLKTFLNQESWKICLEPVKPSIVQMRAEN